MDGSSDQLYRSDDGTALRFYYVPVKNNFQSEKNGRAIYDKCLRVDVLTPGSNESVPSFDLERVYCEEAGVPLPERGEKYMMYEKQIDAFKRQSGEGTLDGTPLTAWPQLDVAQVANLRAQNIFSVEQLAAVTDTHLNNLGLGARVLRDQAAAFLNSRQFSVPSAQMAAEAANLREENIRLTTSVTDLNGRLTAALAEIERLGGQSVVQPPIAAPLADPMFALQQAAAVAPIDPLFAPQSAAPAVI